MPAPSPNRGTFVLGALALASAALLFLILGPLRRAQAGPERVPIEAPKPMDARIGVLEAFERFPLVALSEAHGMKEEAEFINSLIRHPDFPGKVDAVVLEAGNAIHQDLIDAYVSGGPVTMEALRSVWRDHTNAALGPRDSSNVEEFFATVREVNQELPEEQRIRVLAGDPPIDWTAVKTREDVAPWLGQRETHYAGVVDSEVMAKGLKALLIMGGAHFARGPLPDGDPSKGLMLQILESKHPGKTFVVVPHEGFEEHNEVWEPRLASWPRPSLALVAGTWLALPRGSGQEDVLIEPGAAGRQPGLEADALLYLGFRNELTMEQVSPDLYRDEAYLQELDRRSRICRGRPLERSELGKPRPAKWAEMFPEGDIFIRKQ
ncbi:MAG: hypothetical protein EYC70_11340 [Planctomycetota bacterium]|nr:MAG: hypothetical protein EYC70_11340 [Planctomycetota bacterium]